MSLAPGARLGAYEIVGLLGAGGMGEVYRARDARLGREVAIKVLPAAFASDPDRLRRFEQEARAAAALNHPNILAVYDIGQHDDGPYIVSELLEGQTLRERLRGHLLPARKAIDCGVQIARGLAAAHEKGIVHRDLKPENIFVTADGRAKILDFGLAKLKEADAPGAGMSDLPTTPPLVPPHHAPGLLAGKPDTVPGVVLGTLGYMSSEQVRGLVADHRADIFALGAVLYEMLSGRRAFRGDTMADTMTAILKEDPEDIPSGLHIPPALLRIVDRCLEKNASARFQSTGDLAFALEAMSSQASPSGAVAAVAAPASRKWLAAALASVAVIGAAALAGMSYFERPAEELGTYRASILPPEGSTFAAATPASILALSPDGRRIVFTARGSGGERPLWLQSLDDTTARPLPGTDGAGYPFWSPDGRYVGFVAQGQLKRIDTLGGEPLTIAPAPTGLEGTWGPDNVILFAAAAVGGPERVIWRVPATGGTATAVTKLDESLGDNRHLAPYFLPDGRHFLYFVAGSKTRGINDPRAVYVGSLDPAEPPQLLLEGGSNAKYASGHLLFLRGQTLMAQAFDAERLTLSGQPTPVADRIATASQTGRAGAFSVSNSGILAYQVGTGEGGQLIWVDRAGRQVGTLGDPGTYLNIELSPDGKRAAVTMRDAGRGDDIWLYDVARGVRSRFTFGANASSQAWSPDNMSVVISSAQNGTLDLYRKSSSGAGAEEAVLESEGNQRSFSWSPDGRFLIYETEGRANDLWVLPLFGDRKPFALVQTQFNEGMARFSPDGRWVAYGSNESGRGEVYVTPFPKANGKWQISNAGGAWVRWRRDGKEIFYVTGTQLMAVPVSGGGASFEVGRPEPLFPLTQIPGATYTYDVSADGQRFLVNALPQQDAAPITLVVNWPALLQKQ